MSTRHTLSVSGIGLSQSTPNPRIRQERTRKRRPSRVALPGKRGSSRTSRSPAFATATWGADGAFRAQARRGRTGSGTEGGESLGCAAHHAMASSDDPRRIAPLPIAERIGADPRFTGKGVVAAFLDAGFYAHPDLTRPTSRILAYENLIHGFRGVEHLEHPEPSSWHGMMS